MANRKGDGTDLKDETLRIIEESISRLHDEHERVLLSEVRDFPYYRQRLGLAKQRVSQAIYSLRWIG